MKQITNKLFIPFVQTIKPPPRAEINDFSSVDVKTIRPAPQLASHCSSFHALVHVENVKGIAVSCVMGLISHERQNMSGIALPVNGISHCKLKLTKRSVSKPGRKTQ